MTVFHLVFTLEFPLLIRSEVEGVLSVGEAERDVRRWPRHPDGTRALRTNEARNLPHQRLQDRLLRRHTHICRQVIPDLLNTISLKL